MGWGMPWVMLAREMGFWWGAEPVSLIQSGSSQLQLGKHQHQFKGPELQPAKIGPI